MAIYNVRIDLNFELRIQETTGMKFHVLKPLISLVKAALSQDEFTSPDWTHGLPRQIMGEGVS